ncbi:uncharacterized protein B0I36DRAFT_66649 [Microdochium trichocladiopsis]|uniref:Secreted protein n=1 Tax=Microdochium trichocladiopsis TaxID=1682393 RepID=A0A9P8YDR9_9PEZI|nr:uncharacterized protein B0I36DRAFT_66649 [Microdochium trichocladiopsis]KAH7037473.1 hypothetical protein B0I36DRAFT_66649 [Microdochium trichocladiopsis]
MNLFRHRRPCLTETPRWLLMLPMASMSVAFAWSTRKMPASTTTRCQLLVRDSVPHCPNRRENFGITCNRTAWSETDNYAFCMFTNLCLWPW